jgi:hypothetical protein
LAAVKLSRGTTNLPAAVLTVPAQPSNPVAPRVAAASMDLTPPDTWAQLEDTRPSTATAQAAAADTTDRDRPRPKAVPARRAPASYRGSCDPPFTLDAFGIKRLKVRCM